MKTALPREHRRILETTIAQARKASAEAHYALESLANKVLAAEYQTVLPNEQLLADEIQKTQAALNARRLGLGGE